MATPATLVLNLSLGVVLLAALAPGGAVLAASAPVDSSLALAANGGGCYPPPIVQATLSDQLQVINPEWAPVVNGSSPVSRPVLMRGSVVDSHISQLDFPSNHVTFDQNTDIVLDAGDAGFLA